MNYNIFIKKCIKKNYKNKTFFGRSFIKSFQNYRNGFLNNSLKKKFQNKNHSKDKTFQKIKKIYEDNLANKNKEIIVYYKKFEINLALKEKYNKKFKKISNIETNYNSYIYLGLLIHKCNLLNIHQKLNCILKILDKICIKKNSYKYINYSLFTKLIKIENKLLKKIKI